MPPSKTASASQNTSQISKSPLPKLASRIKSGPSSRLSQGTRKARTPQRGPCRVGLPQEDATHGHVEVGPSTGLYLLQDLCNKVFSIHPYIAPSILSCCAQLIRFYSQPRKMGPRNIRMRNLAVRAKCSLSRVNTHSFDHHNNRKQRCPLHV